MGDALTTEPGLDEEPGADLQSDSTLDLEESDFEAEAVPPLEDLASELEEAGSGETPAESDAELPAQRPDEAADREEEIGRASCRERGERARATVRLRRKLMTTTRSQRNNR